MAAFCSLVDAAGCVFAEIGDAGAQSQDEVATPVVVPTGGRDEGLIYWGSRPSLVRWIFLGTTAAI